MTIYTDSATLSTKTTPSSSDLFGAIDSSTIQSVTTVISDDRGPFTDTDAPFTITEITTGELEYVHPAGFWGPFDDDDGVI